MVIMFYIFASFKRIRMTKYTDFVEATTESGREANNYSVIRIEANYSSDIREDKLSPDRLNSANG